MFQVTVIDINDVAAKTTAKTWLAKIVAINIHRTRQTYNNACNTDKPIREFVKLTLTLNEDCLSIFNCILI